MAVIRISPKVNFGQILVRQVNLENNTDYQYIYSGTTPSATDPGIRYNRITDTWQFSHNGLDYFDFGTGSGSSTTVEFNKVAEIVSSAIPANTDHTLPEATTYTLGTGIYLDVYFNGQLLNYGITSATYDYIEVNNSTVKFYFEVPAASILTYVVKTITA